jgi:hypothetical protein
MASVLGLVGAILILIGATIGFMVLLDHIEAAIKVIYAAAGILPFIVGPILAGALLLTLSIVIDARRSSTEGADRNG